MEIVKVETYEDLKKAVKQKKEKIVIGKKLSAKLFAVLSPLMVGGIGGPIAGKIFGKSALEFAKNSAKSNPKIAVPVILGSIGIAGLSGTAIYAIKKDYNVKIDGGVGPGGFSFTLDLKK